MEEGQKVYKLVGPVLIHVDRSEAMSNVENRLKLLQRQQYGDAEEDSVVGMTWRRRRRRRATIINRLRMRFEWEEWDEGVVHQAATEGGDASGGESSKAEVVDKCVGWTGYACICCLL